MARIVILEPNQASYSLAHTHMGKTFDRYDVAGYESGPDFVEVEVSTTRKHPGKITDVLITGLSPWINRQDRLTMSAPEARSASINAFLAGVDTINAERERANLKELYVVAFSMDPDLPFYLPEEIRYVHKSGDVQDYVDLGVAVRESLGFKL
jgi:hypothetical protein